MVAKRCSIQLAGVRTLIPIPLSSQTKRRGQGRFWWSARAALLNAPQAVLWFALASPNEQSTMLSCGTGRGMPRRRARAKENAAPMAFGKWLAIVEVCGGMWRGTLPKTLCLPPAIGSSLALTRPRSTSWSGVLPGTCRARCTKKPPER